MDVFWIRVIFTSMLANSATLALNLPNTTYQPTDFAYDSIRKIIEGLGFIYESHEVVTEDGYILNLNRMVNPDLNHTTDKGVPVLLVSGLFGHADSWFLQADPRLNAPVRWLLAGFDVWLGDQRGSVRSVKHEHLSTWSWKFWNFSFHETGYYDMPAWIDFILQKTGHKKLAYSGLSDGGAFYYVLTTSRPEYQDKLYGGVLWSPVGQSPPLSSMSLGTQVAVSVAYEILHNLWDLGPWPYLSELVIEDLPPMNQAVRKGFYHICKVLPLSVLQLLMYDTKGCQFAEQDELCLQLATSLGGTSAKTVLHSIQLFKDGGKFQQYDYGWEKNLLHYNETTPPVYDITKLEVFTALYYSNWDDFAPNNTVVPFAHKFSGPAYECEVDDVCHVFVIFDPRVGPFLEDATNVLHKMTKRTTEKSRLMERENNEVGNEIYKCNVTGHLALSTNEYQRSTYSFTPSVER